jgi:hypothetical protein
MHVERKMANKKSIYKDEPLLMRRLPKRDAEDYDERYKQALKDLFLFHKIDVTDAPDTANLWQQLAVAMIHAHVPAFFTKSVGRPATCDKDWKIRRKLLVEVQKTKQSDLQASRMLSSKWARNDKINLYAHKKQKPTIAFLRKEIRLAKAEQKVEREILRGVLYRLSDLKKL